MKKGDKIKDSHANVARRALNRGEIQALTCAWSGCDRNVYCLGMCSQHYQELRRIQKRNKETDDQA